MRAMAKILKLFWPKSFHLLCFLFLYLQWRWIVDMKSFDQKTVYIMPQNLWMLNQYIDAFLMLNIGIMQKIFAMFSFQPKQQIRTSTEGGSSPCCKFGERRGTHYEMRVCRDWVKCWNNCGCLGVWGRGPASSARPHPSMDCQPQARPVCTTAVMHPLSLFTSDKCEKE